MTLYSADAFTRANSAATLGSTDGAGTVDPIAWTALVGTWGISSNQAYCPTPPGSGNDGIARVELAQADVDLSITVTVRGTDAGITFRITDSTHYWAWQMGATGTAQLFKRNGTFTQVGTNHTGGVDGDVLRVVVSGSSISCYRNGVLLETTTDAFNSTATKHGIQSFDTTSRLDSWSASSVTPLSQNIVVPLLSASPTMFSPTVTPLSIYLPLLDAAPTLFSPTVPPQSQQAVVPLLNAAPTLIAPGVGQPTTPTGATVPAFVVRMVNPSGLSPTALPSAQPEDITWTLNAPTEATLTFPKSLYTETQIPTLATPAQARELQIYYDDDLLFFGPMIQPDAAGSSGAVTLHAADPMWLMNRRNIDGPRDNLLTNGSFESGFTGWTKVGSFTSATTSSRKALGSNSAQFDDINVNADDFYYQQVVVPPNGVGTLLTVSAWRLATTVTGTSALGSRGLFVQGIQGGVVKDYNYVAIDEADPFLGVWHQDTCTIWIPPNQTWTIEVRVYAMTGTIFWDAVSLVAMDSIGSTSITGSATSEADIAAITRLLVAHIQDAAYGKSNLLVGHNTPNNGVKLFRQYQFADHVDFASALSEFIGRDDGFDVSLEITPTTRTFTTHTPKKGTDRSGSVTLTYGGNVADYRWSRSGAGCITRATMLGSGSGPSNDEGEIADASQVGGLILQEVRQAPPETQINSLLPLATERINQRRIPPLVLELDVLPSANLIHTLKVGDWVSVAVDDGYVQASGKHRIVKMTLHCRTRVLTVFVNEDL